MLWTQPGTVMAVILRLRHFNHWDFVNLSTRRFLEYYYKFSELDKLNTNAD